MPADPPPCRPGAAPRLAVAACLLGLGTAAGISPAGPALLAASAPVLLLGAAHAGARGFLLALLLGLLLGRIDDPARARRALRARTALPAVLQLHGRVRAMGLPAQRKVRFLLETTSLGTPPRALSPAPFLPVELRLDGPAPWTWSDLAPGARVRMPALVKVERGRLKALVADRRAVQLVERARGPQVWVLESRHRAASTLTRRLDARDDGLARALLLGDRGRLDRADRALFRQTGQAHLLAVSGLHVGLLLSGVLLVTRLLGAPPTWLWSLGLLVTVTYVPFTGGQPSAIRAGLAASAWFVARLCGRHPRGAAVFSVVFVLVLGMHPRALSEPSFQLSFAAVLGILLLSAPLRRLLVPAHLALPGLLTPRRTPARTALAVSLAAWLGTAPLVAHHIGRLCPAGPCLALLTLPLTALLLGTGFLLLASGAIEPLAEALPRLFHLLADLLRYVLEGARCVHLDALPAARPSPLWHALYAATAIVVSLASGRRRQGALAALGLLLAVLLVQAGVPGLTTLHAPRSRSAPEYDAAPVISAALPSVPSAPQLHEILGVAAGLLLFGLLALRAGWLGVRAAAAAWVLGLVAFLALGPPGVAALMAPFLGATLLGKLPGATRAGARNLRQVLCNGVPAFLGCLLALSGRPDLGVPFFAGALACLGGDSCATEAGVRWGGDPFLLIGRGPVCRGESGGVTWVGLGAALLGSALGPGAFALLASSSATAVGSWMAAGLTGTLLDSALGGTLQFRGRLSPGDELTECADGEAQRVRGWRWLDNDAVNLVSGLAAGFVALALTPLV